MVESLAHLQQAARPAATTAIRALARIGFGAIGVVYLLLGGLAIMAVVGIRGGKTASKEQVFETVLDLPAGTALLYAVAVGLVGYMIWRITQAVADTEGKGSKPKGLAVRFGYVVSGLLHGGLALIAFKVAMHEQEDGSRKGAAIAKLMQHPAGQWLLIGLGLTVIAVGVHQFVRAFKGKLRKEIDGSSLTHRQRKVVLWAGHVGTVARGVVMVAVGWLFIGAARPPASCSTACTCWCAPATPSCASDSR
jgi:hypothetical protein